MSEEKAWERARSIPWLEGKEKKGVAGVLTKRKGMVLSSSRFQVRMEKVNEFFSREGRERNNPCVANVCPRRKGERREVVQ